MKNLLGIIAAVIGAIIGGMAGCFGGMIYGAHKGISLIGCEIKLPESKTDPEKDQI